MRVSHVRILFVVIVLIFSGAFTADALRTGSEEDPETDREGLIMASTSAGGAACSAPVPILLGAVAGDRQITITWSDEHTGNPTVTGYNIYFDRDGQSQPVTSVWPQTMYTHADLTNGQKYCYKITALHADCESGFSNVICATPAGQAP